MLTNWQKNRLATLHSGKTEYGSGRKDVTLLAYHFWDAPRQDTMWPGLECAIRETWYHCGFLKTIVVANSVSPSMEKFAEVFSRVDFQIEPSLVPKDIFSMSADCNGRLASRFDTEYVLIIQNDGFPLRNGLDGFVGKYDFIGAPYVRPRFLPRLAASMLGCWVMNGGFSLRSHAICDFAAHCWNRKYHRLGDCKAASEDIFYTKTLPLRESSFRRRFRLPTTEEALFFSWDALVPIPMPEILPFGFHRAESFERLERHTEKWTL